MLAVLLPILVIGGIILVHLMKPLSYPDRALFAVGLIGGIIGASTTARMARNRSWERFVLDCGPPALFVYPFTHGLIVVGSIPTANGVISRIRGLRFKRPLEHQA